MDRLHGGRHERMKGPVSAINSVGDVIIFAFAFLLFYECHDDTHWGFMIITHDIPGYVKTH